MSVTFRAKIGTELDRSRARVPVINEIAGGREAFKDGGFLRRKAAALVNEPDLLVMGTPTITATQSGSWSDTATWGGAPIPTTGALVDIPLAFDVVYDVDSAAHITEINVEGSLTWALTKTKLVVDTIRTGMNSTLTIGTAANPIPDSGIAGTPQAEIVYKAVTAPGATPRLGMMTMGEVSIHGEVKETTVKVSKYPRTGDSILYFQRPVSQLGWRVGDKILVLSTTNAGTSGTDADYSGPSTYFAPSGRADRERPYSLGISFAQSHDEVRTITAVFGSAVEIDTPLAHDHPGWMDTLPSGAPVLIDPIVSNFTRSICQRSDTPLGSRGHTMHMNANTDIRYCEYQDLGRTKSDPTLVQSSLDTNGMFDSDPNVAGVALADPDNVRGRYAGPHFHETGSTFADVQAICFGNSVWATAGNGPLPGWGIVQHSSRATIEKCVVYNVRGAAYVWERGDEIGQCLDNVAAWCRGDGFTSDFNMRAEIFINHNGHQGVGYEMQARQILMKGNWVSSCKIGFNYFQASVRAETRVPQDVSLRLKDPITYGGIPNAGFEEAWESYGPEQSQIPPFDDNTAAGCASGFDVPHRQFLDQSDQTPMISHGYNTINCGIAFNNPLYSYNYIFWDFLYARTKDNEGGNAIVIGNDNSYGFSWFNGCVRGYNRLASLRSLNYAGYFVDISTTLTGATFDDFEVTGITYDPATQAGIWNVMGVSVMTGADSWKPAPQVIYDSATDYPIPYPNAGTVGGNDYPIGLDLPGTWPPVGVTLPSFVLDAGVDVDLPYAGTSTVLFSGIIYDAVGIRRYPDPYVWVQTSTSNPSTSKLVYKERYNWKGTGRDFVRRNGCFEESPGVWKSRMKFVFLDRAAGTLFTEFVDFNLTTGYPAAFLTANTVDPATTEPDLDFTPESVEFGTPSATVNPVGYQGYFDEAGITTALGSPITGSVLTVDLANYITLEAGITVIDYEVSDGSLTGSVWTPVTTGRIGQPIIKANLSGGEQVTARLFYRMAALEFGIDEVNGVAEIIVDENGMIIMSITGGIHDGFVSDPLDPAVVTATTAVLVDPVVTGTPGAGNDLTLQMPLHFWLVDEPANAPIIVWKRDDVDIGGTTGLLTYPQDVADEGTAVIASVFYDGVTSTSNPINVPAPVTFVPSDLASLVDDMNADTSPTTITDTAGDITQWDNSAGGTNFFVQTVSSSRPRTGVDTSPTGLNVATYESGNFLKDDSSPAFTASGTIFVAFKNDLTTSNFGSVYAADGGTYDFQMQTGNTTNNDWYGGINSTAHTNLQRLTTTGKTWVVQAYRWNAANNTADFWTNGVMDDQVDDYVNDYDAMTVINLGGNRSGGVSLIGKLGQAWRFDAALSDTEMADMFTYAQTRWGI